MKKRILSIIAAAAILASFVVMPAPASAEGEKFKMVYDFEFFDTGFKPGAAKDHGTTGDSQYIVSGDVGVFHDLTIVEGKGYMGKALEYSSLRGGKGMWEPFQIILTEAPEPTLNFEGATELWFYVDISDWGTARGVRPIIYENGCDTDGEILAGEETVWLPDFEKTSYIEAEGGGWKEATVVEDGSVDLPLGYKGFVRVPIDSMKHPPEFGADDTNGKFDGKRVTKIALELGCYAENDGHHIIFDHIGFVGTDIKGGEDLPILINAGGPPADASKAETNESTVTSSPSEESSAGLSLPVILGIVGGVVIIAAVVVIVVVAKKSKKTE